MNLTLLFFLCGCPGDKSDGAADDSAPGDTGCVPISPAVNAGTVSLSWSADLPASLEMGVLSGTAEENIAIWCAGDGLGALTFYFGGSSSPVDLDLTNYAGQTLNLLGEDERVWFADIVAGGADEWVVE